MSEPTTGVPVPGHLHGLYSGLVMAIQGQNWYAALALALTLPDICSWIETGQTRSCARYVPWFDKWVTPEYTFPGNGEVFLSGADAYALRCSYLHQGLEDISEQGAQEKLLGFRFCRPHPQIDSHCNYDTGGRLQLNVATFCGDVVRGIENWWKTMSINADVIERARGGLIIYDMPLAQFARK